MNSHIKSLLLFTLIASVGLAGVFNDTKKKVEALQLITLIQSRYHIE